MSVTALTAAAALHQLGFLGWEVSVEPQVKDVRVHLAKKQLVLSDIVPLEAVVPLISKAMESPADEPWIAMCGSCSRGFARTKRPDVTHFCADCGPIYGALTWS